MCLIITAPFNTRCGTGNDSCNRMIKMDDRNIVRYMGRIYHAECLTEKIMQTARHKNIVAVRKSASCPTSSTAKR